MLATTIALAMIQQPTASRFDLGIRLKQLDVAWMTVSDSSRREKAVTPITKAVYSFFGQRYSDGCRSLDEARAALLGRNLLAGDAITLRLEPAVVEPGQKANLKISWSYTPEPANGVKVRIGREYKTLQPGEPLETTVDVPIVTGAADAANLRDLGALVSIMVDDEQRSLYVSVVKNFSERIEKLAANTDSLVSEFGLLAKKSISTPSELEHDPPILELVNLAESLESKQKEVWQIESWPRIRHGGTVLRVAFPSSTCKDPRNADPVDVVLAFHGAGGSENLFFEGYGRGICAKEALKRGWVFVAPAASATAATDAIDWLRSVRKLKIGRIFTIGHSMGTATVVNSIKLDPKPTAGALFAPVSVPNDAWKGTPLFMAVGQQEISALTATANQVRQELAGRLDCQSKTYANCEHLMIVAVAASDAFKFFDGVK